MASKMAGCSYFTGKTEDVTLSSSSSWRKNEEPQQNLARPGSPRVFGSIMVVPGGKTTSARLGTKCELLATSPPREVETSPHQRSGIVVTPPQERRPRVSSAPSHFQITREKLEVVESLEAWAQTSLLSMLKPVEKCWQPQDFLPDPSSESFYEDVRELQLRTRELPDDYLVSLVGDMITEEALPTYQSVFNTFEGVRDKTGCSTTPWGVWVRGWTAEENRHGDLLNKYLYLSGRVDMRMVERTTQHLIGSGMASGIDNSPYNGFIYTSFQERATFISHGNTARHAKRYGDNKLATICGIIASDEKRHEIAYTRIMEQIFERDPSGAMIAFEEMMRKKIVMPAHLMFDGDNDNLFQDYAAVAQKCGVYTSKDYAQIIQHLIRAWKVADRVGLSNEAQRAQEYVCNLPRRIEKLEERKQNRAKKNSMKTASFSWLFNKEVALL